MNQSETTVLLVEDSRLIREWTSDIPIIFYSASRNLRELENDVQTCGADGFIKKDQNPAQLLADVAGYLRRRQN